MTLHFPLSTTLRTTKAHLQKLQKMGLETVEDLLNYFPRALESTDIISDFPSILLGQKNTLSGILTNIRKEKSPRGRKTLAKAALTLNDQSVVEVVWFQIPYLLKNLKDDTKVFLVGKVDRSYGKVQILNPEIHLQKDVHIGGLRAIYPESPPITSKWLREKLAGLLTLSSEYEEVLPDQILNAHGFIRKPQAMKAIHKPQTPEDWHEARARLSFEELFEIQLRVMREKHLREQQEANPHPVEMDAAQIKDDLATNVPFELTTAQKKVLYQILKDFESPRTMHRLVQGDVGSGKTIVAFLAVLQIIRKGYQAAFLAPTEILATQHFANGLKFFGAQYSVELLTGSVTEKKKKDIKAKLRNGDIQVLIGTHALLTEDTIFHDLGLAVIDEQHRFGVKQRSTLSNNNCHTLAMTATPIPRSLALTIYGDQDISVINELPPGRRKVITRVVHDDKTRKLCERFIEDHIQKGHQIFWVCPLIDESDKIEAKAVAQEFERIDQIAFPKRKVAFLHGQMKPKQKEKVMRQFKDGEFDILVSTSVIEVGVDIPNATVMVIENAERFGLAQLHQFRGRIGRNDRQCYCFLMTNEEMGHTKRLRAMERHHHGLKLAEIDLEIRGMGELYGTRQSGLPDFRCADINDLETLQNAREWAIKILEQDPNLEQYPKLRKKIEAEEVYF